MYENDIPTRFNVGTQEVGFQDLHRQFAGTVYGQKLNEEVRYDRYRPADMGKSEWRHMLGADVNNLEHMRLTRGLTGLFIRYCQSPPPEWVGDVPQAAVFNQREQENLLLCATVHDWGEAAVGDISFDQKTDGDEEAEMGELNRMLETEFGKNKSAELRSRVDVVLKTVLTDRTTKLGRAFNAIERAGYLRTALIAMDRIDAPEGQPIASHLKSLTNNVLLNQIPTLLGYAELYPPIDALLRENHARITHAFDTTGEDDAFSLYDAKQIEQYKHSFAAAKSLWDTSSFAHPPQPVQ